jgi:GAF domain-containing protein
VIAIENARLFNETREALAQQTATSEVLRVISNSIADTAPVFEKILDSCENLFATEQLGIFLVQPDGQTHVGAWRGDAVEAVIQSLPRPADETATGLVIRNRAVLHIPNTATAQDVPPTVQFTRDQYGDISIAWAPMLTEQGGIGSIAVMRQPPNPFSQKELALLKTFADQAVIAIQNTRLFNETREALARQTATADVLKVIASSPSNLQPVFDAIAERSNGLMHGHSTTVFRLIGNMIELVASTSVSEAADAILRAAFPRPRSTMSGLDLAFRGEMRETIDAQSDAEPQSSRDLARARGFRGRLVVPLKSDSGTIGAISVTRKEPGAFADKDKELLRTFADQAVIAIQNVELFEQVQAKTRDLEESLQQQTATSDVLKMIASSPGDLTPMFDVMLECATRLCEASHCHVWRFDGQLLHAVAVRGDPWFAEWLRKNSPVAPILGSAADRIARGEDIVHVVDRREEEAYSSSPVFRDLVDSSGMRASLSVALRRDGALLGMINVYRQEARPFSDKQIALLQNFADQAIIAMENARLFNETREALARQTATSDVLKVIASSPSNLQPVFDAIAERSKALIGGHSTTVFRFAGDMVELVGATSVGAEADAVLRATFPMPISKMQNIDRTLRGEVSEIVDVMADTQPDDSSKNVARARGWRSRLVVPLKGDNEAIGFISITRKEPGAFADKDKELVRTFADQAVIAIQNVELFEEVQAKTRDLEESLEQQTATADVLKVISRSAFDLQAVLDTLVESAYGLCGASLGLLYLRGEEAFECKAVAGVGVEAASELFKGRPIRAGRSTAAERVILTGEVHAVTDFFADPEFDPIVRDRIRNDSSGSNISQLRSTLAVPMMRENEVVGVMVIARPQTGTFPQRQTELLQTFADQAVIAIENARLFEQVQDRTRELSQSLDDLRTAQDRLVQTEKLASLGQLTAGIAHEIKNPLNFVNNFSALSVELTDELNDVLKQAELTEKIQREVGELTQMLKSNLEKVVQHGKRADSIVKNMLLHSREGSGEQRAADINALVEESLNLAYHGARAEKAGFNITLQREFDAGAGSAELFPQEITRALLNLISNGFYAATRRKAENGDDSFEPMLLATTRNLGHAVEIRIRDNGTGIPSEVKEKMFNPFFTTKPAGEGTGLGLSMTHDIIVKQHGGTIDVATEPGHFTEFIVVLPRTNGAPGRSRDQA